jgi:hypothetical protein
VILNVDAENATGATALYERAGMRVVTDGTCGSACRATCQGDPFLIRSPHRPGSRGTRQLVVPAVLSGSGRDSPQPATSSGTLTAPRSGVRSREFAHPACLDSIAHLPGGRDHSAHVPDHG